MKKRLYLAVFVIGILLINSACEDWLNVKPKSELDASELFSSENGYSEALTGVYAAMTEEALYGKKLTWGLLDLWAGCYYSWGTEWNNDVLYAYKHDDPEQWTETIEKIDEIWSEMYEQIANLNEILGTIDKNKSVFTGDNYEIIKGEAMGLRAFLHFELLRMFGPDYTSGKDTEAIPFVQELTTLVPPLLTVDEMTTILVEQLKEAIVLLEKDPMVLGTTPPTVLASLPSGTYSSYVESWHNRRFHFNYYAAWATLARVYQWKGDKPNALAAAKVIIDAQETRFPWVKNENLIHIGSTSDYYKNQDRTFATEHVFALNIKKLSNYMEDLLYYVGSSTDLFDSDISVFGGNYADPRLQYLFTSISGFSVLSKFDQGDQVYTFFKERMPLIRLSEMYYIAAECEPDLKTAIGYLEKVREHRGLSANPLPTTMSPDAFQKEIENEYRKEFCGEGQLWFYYKRHQVTSIPNMTDFDQLELYTFDRPEDEDLYRGDN